MPEVNLNVETIMLVIAVILLGAQTISTLNKGRKDWRELSGADRRNQELTELKNRVTALETNMQQVETRLAAGEDSFKKIRKDTGQIMDVLDGLLLHFISGNDKEKLKSVKTDLDHYKNTREEE